LQISVILSALDLRERGQQASLMNVQRVPNNFKWTRDRKKERLLENTVDFQEKSLWASAESLRTGDFPYL
jgi:hypothetical protein